MMCLLRVAFIITLYSNSYGVQSCSFTFGLSGSDILMRYLAYDEPIEPCITPSTTVTDNPSTGNVHRILANNLFIPILQKEVVANFSRLTAIQMRNDKITIIKARAFSNLSRLQTLDLSDNKIRALDDEVLFKVNRLRFLNLKGNQLQNFRQRWLGNTAQLKLLNLSHNSFETIPENQFMNLLRLRTVDLSHNKIGDINKNAFNGAPMLEHLDLSYNQIMHFQDNVFAPTVLLRILNLYHNNVTYMPSEVLKNLALVDELIILFNPLPCTCYNKILEWAHSKGVEVRNKKLRCNKATSMENIPVCVIADQIQCETTAQDDLYSILHEEEHDYECYLDISGLLNH